MRNLQQNAGKLNKLEEQIASEKLINRPSDNPVGFTNSLKYKNILNSFGQQQTNMNDGEIFMTVLENTHNSMNKVFGRCHDLAVQSANDTENHDQRLFTNLEIRQLLEQLVADSQTKHKDGYIFTGKWTNQPPYEIKSGTARIDVYIPENKYPPPPSIPFNTNPLSTDIFDANPVTIQIFDSEYIDPNLKPPDNNPLVQRIIPGSVSGLAGLQEKAHLDPSDPTAIADYEINYEEGTITLLSDKAKMAFYDSTTFPDGDLKPPAQLPEMKFEYIYRNSIDMTGEIYREIDTGITMKINSNPAGLFGEGKQGQTDSFKEIISLMQGLWYNDQPEISKSIDRLDDARKRNLAEQAVEGARLNRLEIVFDRNEDLTITNTKAVSQIEDVDVAEALSKFTLAEAVYSASLYATSRLMQQSLMNYL
jgi:flagellar hook-associated protein 3 FlgL